MADSHGNVIYLNERECSLQRRHQKVIEEAPSPFLDPVTRQEMGAQAVALAKAVDYESAGTVEFIVDSEKNFYFLEMNTRLQVEHPVTELITGIDLVELMIRVASGETLPVSQDDIGIDGWAIEARVYAEDPFRNFLPSIGRLVFYRPPEESEHVRVDTGVFEGGEVSMYYDPMIAKLVTYGETREEASTHMRAALDQFIIKGVSSNISFLSALMVHARFVNGQMSTNMIGEEYPDGFHPADVPHEDPSITIVLLNNEYHDITAVPAAGGYDVQYRDKTYAVRSDWEFGQPLFHGTINGEEIHVQVERRQAIYRLSHGGSEADVLVLTPRAAEMMRHMPVKEPPDMSGFLLSPMPGLLVSIAVKEGDEVRAGEELAVLEAMKMENTLYAERDGVVKKINFEPGASLAVDDKIMELD
jgi:propionyl-CoA carboxylase alpha chain